MVKQLTHIFNNREIATIIWSVVFFGFVLSQKSVRESLRRVIEAFSNWRIITYFLLMLLYVAGVVAVLRALAFWNLSLLKDTIAWLCFSGIALGFTSVTSGRGENVFKDAIADNVKAAVLLEFIANTHTFPLVGELVFVPVVSLVVLLAAVTRAKEEYATLVRVLDVLQVVIGVGILILSVRDIIVNYERFVALDTASELLLPPVLSISFLPFMYLGLVFIRYESLLLNLDLGREKSPSLKRYAKRKLFSCCGLRLKRVQKMLSKNASGLRRIEAKEDVDQIVAGFEGS